MTLPYLAKVTQEDGKDIEFCSKLERTKSREVIGFPAQQRFFTTRGLSPRFLNQSLHQLQKVHPACSSVSRQVMVLSITLGIPGNSTAPCTINYAALPPYGIDMSIVVLLNKHIQQKVSRWKKTCQQPNRGSSVHHPPTLISLQSSHIITCTCIPLTIATISVT